MIAVEYVLHSDDKSAFKIWLIISIYVSSLPFAHLSDALRKWLVITGIVHGYRTKLLRALPGSLTCSCIALSHGTLV